MSGTIKVEASLFPSISSFYQGQRGDLLQAKSYVQQYCTLSDAFGLLLSMLKTPYEDARDKVFGAFGTIADTMDALADQVEGYVQDVEDTNGSIQSQLDAINQQLQALQAQQAPSGQPGGGGGGGGGGYSGGGGGYSGGGGGGGVPSVPQAVVPQQPVAPPTESGGGNTYIFNGDGPVYVETGPGDLVVDDGATQASGGAAPTDGAAVSGSSTPTGDPTAGAGTLAGAETPAGSPQGAAPVTDPTGAAPVTDPTGTAPVTDPTGVGAMGGVGGDPGQHAPLTPEQEAKYSELYKQVWQEQAAQDPLGRSADELQAAWEAREPVKPEAGIDGGFGYAPEKGATLSAAVNLTLLGTTTAGLVHSGGSR